MSFNQGQFNFDAKGSEDGYHRWREELDEKKRAFESRWGIILNRPVSVSLLHHAKPLTGSITWITDPKKPNSGTPKFRIGTLEFTPAEIESIVQLST